PPPDSAAEVRSPCWRRAIHRTMGRAGATSARVRPANRYQDRHAVSRFSSQARTRARPTVLPYRPQGGGLSPITLSPPLPLSDAGRPIHILPAEYARTVYWPVAAFARADAPVLDVGAMARSAKGWWCQLCWGIGVSMRRRTGPQTKTQRSGMQVHVFTAHCTDAGPTVDRRGRRACLLKGLPHEEIAPRCVRRRRHGRRSASPAAAWPGCASARCAADKAGQVTLGFGLTGAGNRPSARSARGLRRGRR